MAVLVVLTSLLSASCSSESGPGAPAPELGPEASEPGPEAPASAPAGAPNEKPLDAEPPPTDTADGAVYNVPDTIASDCSRPVEQEIMEWLVGVPNGGTAVFAHEGCYGQDGTITLDDRSDLTVNGNGSTFKALTEGLSDRSNWRIRSGNNITIRNMVVRGSLTERQYVAEREFQHGYAFQGTRGGLLENVRGYNVYGDFVEAQHDSRLKADVLKAPPATDIVVRSAHFDMAGRMGLGLTSVDGFLIEDSYVGNVALSAVDVEPDVAGQQAKNIRVLNNTFGRVSHGMFVSHGKGGAPHVGNVLVADNVMEVEADTCVAPIFVRGPSKDRRSDYTFRDNQLLAKGHGMRLDGLTDVTISGNTIRHVGRACPAAIGVTLYDAHDVSVEGNVFAGAKEAVRQDPRSTNVSEQDNRLQ